MTVFRRRIFRGALALLALAFLLPSCGSSAPPEKSPKQTVAEQLDAALVEAESVAAAVRDWLARHASGAVDAIDDLAQRAERAARDLREGMATTADGRTGLRLYTPETETDWTIISDTAELPSRVVLLIHGLDEPGDIWDDLAPALADARHTVVRFDYPNDQRIAHSADLLGAALARLKTQGAQRIDLVAHSMGGLLARDVLTREALYAGDADQPDDAPWPDINRLILVGAPNYGSPFARLRILAEIREQLLRWFDDRRPENESPLAFLADGTGQAGEDLAVNSPYLTDLNSRPLPSGVDITCIIGRMAPHDANMLDDLLESEFAKRMLGENAEEFAADLRALSSELGDGVVPVSSARLKGVEDIVAVHANHRTMLKTLGAERLLTPITGEAPSTPPAIPIILERLDGDDSP